MASALQSTFKTAALIPDRTLDTFDFEQIATNVSRKAIARFERKLGQPEYQKLSSALVEEYARSTGRRVVQVEAEVASLGQRFVQVEEMAREWGDQMDEIRITLDRIAEAKARLQDPMEVLSAQSGLTAEDLVSLRTQLESYEDTLKIYAENEAEYAEPQHFPVQSRKNINIITKRVAKIRRQLGMAG